MTSALPIAREYSHQFLIETAKGAAIGAGVTALVPTFIPLGIAGGAIVGAVVHAGESFASWLGRHVFYVEPVSIEQVTGDRSKYSSFSIESNGNRAIDPSEEPKYSVTEKVMHCLKLAAQIALSILATAFVTFNAIHFAPAVGITEKTVTALAGSLTLQTTLIVTSTVVVGLFIANTLYQKFMA
jgi:hypothetical protein